MKKVDTLLPPWYKPSEIHARASQGKRLFSPKDIEHLAQSQKAAMAKSKVTSSPATTKDSRSFSLFPGKKAQQTFAGGRSVFKEKLEFKLPSDAPDIKAPPSVQDTPSIETFGLGASRAGFLLYGGRSRSLNITRPSVDVRVRGDLRSGLKPINDLDPLLDTRVISGLRIKQDEDLLHKPALQIRQRQKQTPQQQQQMQVTQEETVSLIIPSPRAPKTPRRPKPQPRPPKDPEIIRPFRLDFDLPKEKKTEKKKKKKKRILFTQLRKRTASAYAFTAGIKAPEPVQVTKTGLSIRGF